MKIAVVTPYLPYPPDTGGKIRSFYLLRNLVRSHTVDLFTVYYGDHSPQAGELRNLCVGIYPIQLRKNSAKGVARLARLLNPVPPVVDHFSTPASLAEVRQHLRAGNYELLVIDEVCMVPYARGFSGPKLVMRHKVDHLHYRDIAAAQPFGLRKMIQQFDAYKLRHYERRAMAEFQVAVCCSEDDRAIIHALNPEVTVTVVGNGVDVSRFVPMEESSGPPTLLYVGTMHYYPNIDAIHYFFQEIHPHLIKLVPNAQVVIVGHDPPAEILAWQRLPGVEITGSVADVRPYLAKSTAVIVPLRLGGGTRLKILESMAAGRPVVSTSVGAEGLGVCHGEHLLLADDPVQFARQAAELLRDGDLRRRLIAAARPFVVARYSWQALGEQYEVVCRQVGAKGTL